MKNKTLLIVIAFALALSGCTSLSLKDTSVKGREVSFSILNVITYSHTTEEAVIGSVETEKE